MGDGGTIAAIASPRGHGRRGVLRVSGPGSWDVVRATWCGPTPIPDPERRGFHIGRFDDGRGEQPLMLLWMPGPRSFTREDVAEFHLPGAPFLLEAALERILSLDVGPAGPGEFTRRAFENGRIDLTRAEGILALVHARGEAERRSASALLFGGLADRLTPLREGLSALWALAEASLDFDEADTGHVPGEELEREARRLLDALDEAVRWEERRVATSDLPRVVLVGSPNVGKSSLFNVLVSDAQALVSAQRGTTRDMLHGRWETPAGEVRLFDTAGLEQQATGPDACAQRIGLGIRESADLQLWVVDRLDWRASEFSHEAARLAVDVPFLLVWNKTEEGLDPPRPLPGLERAALQEHCVSALTGAGLDQLAETVGALTHISDGAAGPPPERLEREIGVRHRAALQGAFSSLSGGLEAWLDGLPLDLFAEALRDACGELDGISGTTTPEDLLDRIFAAFCIGK